MKNVISVTDIWGSFLIYEGGYSYMREVTDKWGRLPWGSWRHIGNWLPCFPPCNVLVLRKCWWYLIELWWFWSFRERCQKLPKVCYFRPRSSVGGGRGWNGKRTDFEQFFDGTRISISFKIDFELPPADGSKGTAQFQALRGSLWGWS